jgi:hypothetical protein
MTVRDAVVQKGQLVLKSPLELPDGTVVRVQVDEPVQHPLTWLAEHAVDTGIADLAEEHDHYIYGSPKRKNTRKRKN